MMYPSFIKHINIYSNKNHQNFPFYSKFQKTLISVCNQTQIIQDLFKIFKGNSKWLIQAKP